MFNLQNAYGALKISRAIFLGLVTISLISLSLVISTPAGVSAAIPPLPIAPIGPVAPPANPPCKTAICGNPVPPIGPVAPEPAACPLASIGNSALWSSNITTFDAPAHLFVSRAGWAGAINNLGDFVGTYDATNGNPGVFVRHANGTFTRLVEYSGGGITPFLGINDLGQVVGTRVSPDYTPAGWVYANGQVTILPDWWSANGINNLGQVSGTYNEISFYFFQHLHGFVRAANGTITKFDADPKIDTESYGINNLGQVVGAVVPSIADPNPLLGYVRDANGTIAEFGFLPGQTVPAGINDLGQVAGYYTDSSDHHHGFVRDANGHRTQFDVAIPNAVDTTPAGINNLGQVVGSYRANGHSYGFVRDTNGTIYPFAAPGASHTFPFGINDWGQIVGYFSDSSSNYPGNYHGFVTTPFFAASCARLSVQRTDIVPSAGSIIVFGSFTLGSGRTINPLTDPLIVRLYRTGAVASIALPGGSFHFDGRYVYEGVLHGVPVTVHLYPFPNGRYDFAIYAAGVPGLLPGANPVTVLLSIGNNTGAASVTATIH